MEKNNHIVYIQNNVYKISVDDRQAILQMIINANVASNKIQTKGDGTEIKFSNIPAEIIRDIYHFIQQRINNQNNIESTPIPISENNESDEYDV